MNAITKKEALVEIDNRLNKARNEADVAQRQLDVANATINALKDARYLVELILDGEAKP